MMKRLLGILVAAPVACLLMLIFAVPALAQSVTFDHGASATATGSGAAGTPSLSFNVTAGQNRIVFIAAVFERDHCTTDTPETSTNCIDETTANSNFAAPTYVANNSGNLQIQFSVTGSGGSQTVTNPLGSPNGYLRFGTVSRTVTGNLISRTAYSQEMYFVALYESQLRTLLGGAPTGTITIGLPNVDAPNRAGDEALLSAAQFNNVNQLATGAAGTGIVRSQIDTSTTNCNTGSDYDVGVGAPGDWSICLNGYEAGQAAPLAAGDGLLLLGVNGYARTGPMDFATVPGFSEVMNPAVINTDPSTAGTAGAHFLAGTESDGFSTSFQFASGIPSANIEMQSQNDSLTSAASTTGGMAAKFTLTRAALDLAITKTDGITSVASGQSTTYTVVVTNNSTVNYADGAVITDPLATGLSKTAVGCTAAGGAVCPAGLTVASLESGATIPTLPPGGSLTFTVTATVAATSGSVTNVATIATPPGYTDTNAANNTAQDVDNVQPNFGTCDARMFLSQSPNSTTNTTLHNVDTSSNPFTFPPIGQGSFVYNATGYNPTDNYVYAIRYQGSGLLNQLLRVGADGSTTNLGAVSGLPSQPYNSGAFSSTGVYYVKPTGNNSTLYAINVDTRTATAITLNISFDASDMAFVDGTLYSVSDGGQLYSINTSTGQVTAIGSPTGGGILGAQFGAPNGLFGSLNGGGFYQIDLVTGARTLISGSPGAAVNDGANCPTANITFPADLTVTKTNTPAQGPNDLTDDSYLLGETRTYTLVVTNNGPFGVQNATVSDPVPAGIDASTVSWNCTSTSGGAVCGAATGTGALNDAGLDLPAGAVATYTVTMTVPANFTGDLVNTVTVALPESNTDPTPGNNAATDTDPIRQTDLRVLKTVTPSTAVPSGQVLTYSITVTNGGPADATNATLADTPSAGLDCSTPSTTATCSASGGASCPSATVSVGDLTSTGITIPALPVGGQVVVTMQCTVTATGTP